MENIRDMIDVNTVIGDCITAPDGTIIIPVSKVSFGFVTGGGEYGEAIEEVDDATKVVQGIKYPFGGGTGAGITVMPTAFLVVTPKGVELLPTTFSTSLDKLIDKVPNLMDKLASWVKDTETKQEKTVEALKEMQNNMQ